MTKEMEYLMHLFSCGVLGLEPEPCKEDINWHRLIELAREQTVVLSVASVIKCNPDLGCPDDLRAELCSELLGTALKRKIQQENIFALLDRIYDSGIHYILLKGVDIARFYNMPECRISADTDILVAPEDKDKACEFLKREGFFIKPQKENTHEEISCVSDKYGLIELHTELWSDVIGESLFKNIKLQRDSRIIEYAGHQVCVLQPDAAAVFLTLHMVKHFVYMGMSLRMIMDTLLYIRKNCDENDIKKFKQAMKKYGYTHFLTQLLDISKKHLGFDDNCLPKLDGTVDDELEEQILEDIEQGGCMGLNKEEERWNVWIYYLAQQSKDESFAKKRVNFAKRLFRRTGEALFPNKNRLAINYPDIKNHAWKYPFYWCHRLIFRVGKRVVTGKLHESMVAEDRPPNAAERKRLELLRNTKTTGNED